MNLNKYYIVQALLICLLLSIPSVVLFGNDDVWDIKLVDKSDIEKVNIYLEQSKVARENYCWQESFDYADKALQLANQIGYNQGIAQAKVKIGIYYIIISDYDTALIQLFEALKLFQDLEDLPGHAVVYNALGRLYHNLGSFQKAEDYLVASLEIKRQVKDSLQLGIAYMNLANLKLDREEYDLALKYHYNSLNIFKNINDSLNISKEYNNLANVFYETGDMEQALKYHNYSIDIKQAIQDYEGLAYSYCNIGSIYADLDELENAVGNFNQALTIAESRDLEQVKNIILLDKGRAYLCSEEYSLASQCFEQSLSLSKKLSDSLGLAKANMKLAEVYFALSENSKAISYGQTAKDLFCRLDLADSYSNSILFLVSVYKEENDLHNAFQYQVLYANIKDSLNILARDNLIASSEAKIKAESKIKQFEYERILQDTELANQKLVIVLLSSFSFILLISLIIILKMRKAINSSHVLLDKANEQFIHIDDTLSQDMQNDLFYLSYHFAKISKDQENKEALDTYRKFVDKFNRLKQYIVSEAE